MNIKYQPHPSKQVLNKGKKGNAYQCSYFISPYIGCEFKCVYCHKYLDKDGVKHASKEIKVDIDAAQRLRKELKNAKRGVVCIFGYQPVEKEHRIIRKVLEVLAKRTFPIHIITISDIVLDDLDLIFRISKNNWCTVTFCISTLDESIANIFEPFAPSPKKRMEALGKVAKKGITTGVALAPVLPYITDSNSQLEDVIGNAKALNAQYVNSHPVKLEDNCRSRVIDVIKRHFPKLLLKYRNLYEFGSAPDVRYSKKLRNRTNTLLKKYEIESGMPYYPTKLAKKQASIKDFIACE